MPPHPASPVSNRTNKAQEQAQGKACHTARFARDRDKAHRGRIQEDRHTSVQTSGSETYPAQPTKSSSSGETAFVELFQPDRCHRARTPHPGHLKTKHTATLGTNFLVAASEMEGLGRNSPDLNPGSATGCQGPACLQR